MIVTIVGLERHAIYRMPNGIECDACGKRINFDRKEAKAELRHLACEGWMVPDANRVGSYYVDTFCPACRHG